MTAALRLVPAPSIDLEESLSIGPLPFALTPLVGRDVQVAAVTERLLSPAIRLLTLIGPGGIGKTRLAMEAAHSVRQDYEDGVKLIRLASVSDPTLVPVILARALDVRGSPDDHVAWLAAFDRHCLLVIDNFEQLMEAAPGIVDVLSRCPRVTMLISSREPLHVSGEHEYQVPPLTTPPDDAFADLSMLGKSDAVRLFVERAVAVQPEFRLTLNNASAVAHITRQLEGLPLAIELAAARTKHFTPQELADRFAEGGDVLQGGPVDRPPHQRAIRDSIAWSYDLLDAEEQVFFRRLSIFAGGFLPQVADFVCGTDIVPAEIKLPRVAPGGSNSTLDHCISLVDKNLIFKSGDIGDEPRFSMLLTIRGFALAELQQFGEWEAAEQRHAAWYLAFAKVAAAEIRGPSQTAWLDWIEVEHPNLRVALDYFRGHNDTGEFAELANALSMFWLVRGHLVEGLRWLQMVFEAEGTPVTKHPLQAQLLCAAGWLALRQGLPDIGRGYAEESLAAARRHGDPIGTAAALRLLGDIEDRLANYGRAKALLGESLVSYRDAGDVIAIADTLTGLAGISMDTGDYDEAERIFREAVAAATVTGDAIILARAIDSLSVTLQVKGKSTEALQHAERALDLYQTHGNVRGIAVAMDHVGKCSRSLGDPIRAWSCHRDSLAWRRKVGDPRGMVVWLEAMAGLLASVEAFDTAACVLGAADSIRQRGGFPIHIHELAQLEPTVHRIGDHVSSAQFAASRARGSLMTLPEIVELAHDEADRAVTAWSQKADPAPPDDAVDGIAILSLTSRERDVARLLAQRLSDKDIAGRLSISPRTVSTHTTAILRKLGLHSRRDVSRFAIYLELDPPARSDGSASASCEA